MRSAAQIIRIAVVAILATTIVPWCVAEDITKPPGPIELIHADILRNRTRNGKAIKELIGSVHLMQDSLHVTCDKAFHFQQEGRLIFEGNVVFWDTVRTLNARHVVYNEITKRVNATGDVVIVQDTMEIQCQKAMYFDEDGEAFFDGGVLLTDLGSGSTIAGRKGTYLEQDGFAKVMGDPVFTERDTTNSVRMKIFGEQIEYRTEDGLAIARDSVLVLREDLKATSDLLEYNRDEGWAVLTGSPKIISNRETMQGDTISLFFRDGNIDRVLVNDHALAVISADTLDSGRMNWMRGETIDLSLEDGQLNQAVITGQAEALYYPLENGEPRGANRVSGDQITLWTSDGEISRIKVSGGTQGTYYPERMAARANH